MSTFRVPFTNDPERRQALFNRVQSAVSGRGKIAGDRDSGEFRADTPLGSVEGSYRMIDESAEIEFTLHRKPVLVPSSLIESETRKFVAQV